MMYEDIKGYWDYEGDDVWERKGVLWLGVLWFRKKKGMNGFVSQRNQMADGSMFDVGYRSFSSINPSIRFVHYCKYHVCVDINKCVYVSVTLWWGISFFFFWPVSTKARIVKRDTSSFNINVMMNWCKCNIVRV